MFLYKLLEKLSIGPETHFLLLKFSSNQGKISLGNYIMTKDITAISNDENIQKKVFYEDNDLNSFPIFEDAFKTNNFLIKFFAIASLSKIFCLADAIGDNFRNYGILKINKKEMVEYDLKLIDHLPICSNGNIFKYYSPGSFTISKFFRNNMDVRSPHRFSCLRKIIENMTEHGQNKSNFSSTHLNLDEEVLKFIEMKKIFQAIELSEREVLDLFNKEPKVFLVEKKTIEGQLKEIFGDELLRLFSTKIKNNYYFFFNEYGNKIAKTLLPSEKCRLTITVDKKIKQADGLIIKIVGNISQLGNWLPNRGLNMKWDKIWTLTTSMQKNCLFQWKFVVYNMIKEEVVSWESGDNRISFVEEDELSLDETWRN